MSRALLPFVNARLTAVSNWTGAEDATFQERDVIDVGQDLSEAKHSRLWLNDIGFEPAQGDTVTYVLVDVKTGEEGDEVSRKVRDAIRYEQLDILYIEAWDA
jgi:hypothetical protein